LVDLIEYFEYNHFFEYIMSKTLAIIYARVSSSGSLEYRQNTDRQVKDLTEYAAYKGYDLEKTYTEHISGAKKNTDRPALQEAIEHCKTLVKENDTNVILLVSELSRVGRNAFEVLETIKTLVDFGINLYLQKEQMTLLDDNGKPSLFAPIMLATLSTCAQLERENIQFRLNSGRKRYIENGGKLGRPQGSVKTTEQKMNEYKEVITLLRKNYTMRDVAKLSGKSVSSVQRIKKLVCI
jgi:DNA invertase Pin-like site-specific DNA recombinase